MNTTPVSLLERLRDPAAEQAAWEQFVQLYTPLLCQWARRLGLQECDVADVVQEVFAILVRKLPEFRYDPSRRFRGWLWTITQNKVRERHRRQHAGERQAGNATLAEITGPDTAQEVDEAEYRQYLVRRALEVMRAEFQPTTWQAFWQCAVQERPAAEVARDLGLSENAVYLARGRVLRYLRKELEGLLD